MDLNKLKQEATEYATEWGDKTDGTYACCRSGYLAGAEPRENRIVELEKICQDLSDKFDYQVKQVMNLEKEKCELLGIIQGKDKVIAELEAQIKKLIDFVVSKTECCDVCPIIDTCINSEGTCPYTEEIITRGEEEVTREWLVQFISRR